MQCYSLIRINRNSKIQNSTICLRVCSLPGRTERIIGLPISKAKHWQIIPCLHIVMYYHNKRINSEIMVIIMTRSDLISLIAKHQSHLAYSDVELAVKCMLTHMSETLASGERIEIRGFGSFSLSHLKPRQARNPKTGKTIMLPERYIPRFKPGKELRERVNASRK